MDLDAKDRKLLEELQKDGRQSLTILSKSIGLSIDSTHKRLKKLQEGGVVYFRALIDPKEIGFDLVVNVQIKLHNMSAEELARLMSYLQTHPNVIDLITVLGDFDITCVIIAKNTEELESTSRDIRQKFKGIIADWRSVINLRVHKFEEYDLSGLQKATKK